MNDEQKSPENATAEEVLLPKTEAKVNYGGREYEIKRLKLKQLLGIIKLVSSEAEKIRVAMIKNQTEKGATTQLEDILVVLECLEENKHSQDLIR